MPTGPSPLMVSTRKQLAAALVPPKSSGFWEPGHYYELDHYIHRSSSLECDFDGYMAFAPGTPFVCDRFEVRPMTSGEDSDLFSANYVVVKTLDPRDPTNTLSFGFWNAVQLQGKFSKIESELLVIAIAATGLAT